MSNANIRGLPDERPRPSVANLIGRFEQRASKRQSMTGASPTASPSVSRSTSVVSHNTGDSALIETKERREWPPRQLQSKASSNATSPGTTESDAVNFSDLRRSLSQPSVARFERSTLRSPPLDASNDPSPPSLSASIESSTKDTAESVANSNLPSNSAPVPEVEKADTSKTVQPATARTPGKLAASKSNPTSTNSVSRTTPRPSAAAQAKSTSSTPNKNGPPAAKSLTSQRTGSSTASAGAASRVGAKSPPVSGSRAKTPNALRASTSGSAPKANGSRAKTPTASSAAAARPKTPSATAAGVTRPKTPSGLHAPTKASLARARNVEEAPLPVHKPTVPLSSLERLMKPTAASASKARGSVASPPRAAPAKTERGAVPTRGTTVKPRVGLAPARMKADREKKEKEQAARNAKTTTPIEKPVVSDHTASEDEYIEQPSFVSSEPPEPDSLSPSEHELEQSEVPSDIESYDDAFASDDDDRELDSAHIKSALPREEGDLAPFSMTPDAEASFTLDVPEVKEDEHVEPDIAVELEETKEEEEVEVSVPESEVKEATIVEVEPTIEPEESSEPEVKLETIANGAATPKPTAARLNGLSVADDEFDSVLDTLQVKPVRAASPPDIVAAGEIPDEE